METDKAGSSGQWTSVDAKSGGAAARMARSSAAGGLQSVGLSSNPFSKSSVAGYLPLLSGPRQAIAQLTQAIESRGGLMVLTGEVGTGKTTVLNQVRSWLAERRMPTAYLFNPLLDAGNFIDFVLSEFGIERMGPAGNLFTQFSNWLFARYRAGATAVLIIDEAQTLAPSVLQALGPLMNLESSGEKLLQILLAGQPELNDVLRRPEFRPIRQRIAVRCRTAPLTAEETQAYVALRLRAAGCNSDTVFSTEALDAVRFYSRGIPRVVNLLCEHALVRSCTEQLPSVPASIVDKVARDFQFDDARPVPPPLNDGLTDATLRAMRGRPTRENVTAPFASEAAGAESEASTPHSCEAEEPQTVSKPTNEVSLDPRAKSGPVLLHVVPSPTAQHSMESAAPSTARREAASALASAARLRFAAAKELLSNSICGLRHRLRSFVQGQQQKGLRTTSTLPYRPKPSSAGRYAWSSLAKRAQNPKQVWASVVHWLNQPMQIRSRG